MDFAIAVAVGVLALGVLLSTSRDIAMGFDEAFTVRREIVLAEWFAGLVKPPANVSRADFLSRSVLEKYWRFSRREPDGHPPFYALLGLAGWYPTRDLLDPLSAYRFGPMLLTAATCGALYLSLASRHGRVAGVLAPLFLLATPRIFTHAHYAHYDMPVTCLWLLTQIAFLKALQKTRWALAFGLFLGLAAATKLTGWFALAPPLAWTALCETGPAFWASAATARRRMPALRCVLIGIPIAALVLVAVQPPWWSDPLWGVARFFRSNLTREQSVPVPSLYMGAIYPFALPWHNTLVLTAITTPVLILVLGFIGLLAVLFRMRSDSPALIWPLSFATLMVVRALPAAPGHDVERLLLPSLASLAVLAALGGQWLVSALRRKSRTSLGYALIAAALLECAAGFAAYYPYNLSYYNLAVGGLPGATRLGFEPTYYWDTLGPEFCRWIREERRRAPAPLEVRLPFNELSVFYLRAWGQLPADLRIAGFDQTERPLYILQRTPGAYAPWDKRLERDARPLFAIRRRGIELLRIYSFEDAERAFRATIDDLTPSERARRLGP